MARGQSQAADKQLATTNAAAQGYGNAAAANNAQLGTQETALTDQANQLVNSKGWDPATLSAITNSGMGSTVAPFVGAEGQLKRNAASRGNQASIAGDLDKLALNKGIAAGGEAGQIQMSNADFANQQRQAGLGILQNLYNTKAGLYNTNVGAETSLYGQGPGTLNARAAGGSAYAGLGTVLGGVGGMINPIKLPGV